VRRPYRNRDPEPSPAPDGSGAGDVRYVTVAIAGEARLGDGVGMPRI